MAMVVLNLGKTIRKCYDQENMKYLEKDFWISSKCSYFVVPSMQILYLSSIYWQMEIITPIQKASLYMLLEPPLSTLIIACQIVLKHSKRNGHFHVYLL